MPASCSVLTISLNSVTCWPCWPRWRVLVVRREEADGVVAPVVAQAPLEQVGVVEELVHRQQLDGGDAERSQVLDERRVGDAGIGAAELRVDVGMAHRGPLHVGLVDHGVGPRHAQRRSCPQSKNGFTTMPRGVTAALSLSSRPSGSPNG